MIEKLKKFFVKKNTLIESSNSTDSNNSVLLKQSKTLIFVLLGGLVATALLITLVQNRRKEKIVEEANPKLQVEVAAEAIDPEKMWHNYFEDKLHQSQQAFEDRLKLAEESFANKERELGEATKLENEKLKEQLNFAKEELKSAAAELGRVSKLQQQAPASSVKEASSTNMTAINLGSAIEFDKPKSSEIYIPETTYLQGYLLTGLTLSTGMSAPSNPTSGVIVITGRGNLSKNFKVDVTTCKIRCSAYGDLSSERANIRLESMICTDPESGLITRTEIAGYVQGPDNGNGIKGHVVATSTKHIKNAMLGGLISGLATTAKGQDPMTITSLGAIDTKQKGFAQIAGGGMFSGASNAAEKLADYHLRQAEAMSPVLTIAGGVKIEAVFTKGFFFGEQGVRRQIEKLRKDNQNQERGDNQNQEVSHEESYQ